MATAQMKMPDEFLNRLSKLGERTDDVIRGALKVGGEIAANEVRANLKAVVGKGKDSKATGELAGALGVTKARQGRNGDWDVKIGFAEPRKGQGRSNALIANVLEHGRHGQPPRPFLTPAKTKCRKRVIDAMKSHLERELK